MRPRLIRRCLLFGLLGLATSVAIAWGAAARAQTEGARSQLARVFSTNRSCGAAVLGRTPVFVVVHESAALKTVVWQASPENYHCDPLDEQLVRSILETNLNFGGAQPPVITSLNEMAERGPPFPLSEADSSGVTVEQSSAGWPALALRRSTRWDTVYYVGRASFPEEARAGPGRTRAAFNAPAIWAAARSPAATSGTIVLPLEPRLGLLLNTIFYGLLWALVLLTPGTIRRRIRRARGRCPECGYSLRGQPAPGCPECGQGREAVAKGPEEVAKWQSGEVAK